MPILKKIQATMEKLKIPEEILSQFNFAEETGEGQDPIFALIEKMDALLTPEQRLAIMGQQGCCKSGQRDRDCKAFAKEHADLSVEERLCLAHTVPYMMSPQIGEGRTFTLTMSGYQNGVHTGKTTCSCGCIKKLRQPFSISPTYCGCCGGHFRYHYQNLLGVPVRLKEIVSSPLNTQGDAPCCFRFEWGPEKDQL